MIDEAELLQEDLSKVFVGGFSAGGVVALSTFILFKGGPIGGVSCFSSALWAAI